MKRKYRIIDAIKKKQKPKDPICNSCGELCISKDDMYNPMGMIDAVVSGNYSSTVLSDLTDYQFSMCENCILELFKTFKVPVKTYDILNGEYSTLITKKEKFDS